MAQSTSMHRTRVSVALPSRMIFCSLRLSARRDAHFGTSTSFTRFLSQFSTIAAYASARRPTATRSCATSSCREQTFCR